MPKRAIAKVKKFYTDHEREFLYSALGASVLTIAMYKKTLENTSKKPLNFNMYVIDKDAQQND